MNLIGITSSVVGSLTGFLLDDVNSREFANSSFVGLCTITESHVDRLVITDHPVEYGANISDHAYKEPMRVNIEFAYNPYGSIKQVATSVLESGTLSLPDNNEMYKRFLSLQESRNTFDIITGKRKYTNMLIESLEEETSADTENILRIHLQCREVITVYTEITEVDKKKQASPSKTGGVSNKGTKSLAK